jgi:hypothetical protein
METLHIYGSDNVNCNSFVANSLCCCADKFQSLSTKSNLPWGKGHVNPPSRLETILSPQR